MRWVPSSSHPRNGAGVLALLSLPGVSLGRASSGKRGACQTAAVGTTARLAHHGSVLLEVILALALFVTAAAIVTSGMNASTESLERQRLNTHAANLAATALAEVQLGIRSPALAGEQPFLTPFEKWTAETVITPTETETGAASGLLRVEVIIRHQESPLVRRLTQVIRVDPNRSALPAAF
ncbi:MAG: hypothetical protein HZA92_00555 [Verrucomicrobia bacterium]|nr:hypothetical protein [Verrucomicrobiota bacterium]